MPKIENTKLHVPCLKGRIGDWFYYSALLKFSEVSKRIKLPTEINKKYADSKLKLDEMIQREISKIRVRPIKSYLENQDQRFFNSLVLGIYDGEPSWQELQFKSENSYSDNPIDEEELIYFSKTFGVLTLNGNESIFAIDGQHRSLGIRMAIKENNERYENDEISVIFVAHKNTKSGKERTRRLFSTLNRYAKPVNKSEIIALSEDDNCAIITRKLITGFNLFSNKIIVNKSRPISQKNKNSFTSIIMLYDIVTTLLTDQKVSGYGKKLKGVPKDNFINNRDSDKNIDKYYTELVALFSKIIDKIPSLKSFFTKTNNINRESLSSSLLFKVIGQNVFFDVIKVSRQEGKLNEALDYFEQDTFNLKNKIWKKVFWDEETNKLDTSISRQKYCKLLILEKIGIQTKKTKKDQDIESIFSIPISKI